MALEYKVIYEDEFGNETYGYVDDGIEDTDSQGDVFTDYLSDEEIANIYADPSRAQDVVKTVEDGENWVAKTIAAFGTSAGNALKKTIFNGGDPAKGLNLAGLATGALGLYSLFGNKSSNPAPVGGYSRPVPDLAAVRAQVPYAADPNRRPGEAGRSYFTDMQYKAPADAPAAQTAANTQAQGIASAYTPRTAVVNPYASGEKAFPTKYNPVAGTGAGTTTATNASGIASVLPISARMPAEKTSKTDDESWGKTMAAAGAAPYMPTMGGPYTTSQKEMDTYMAEVRNKTAANTGAVSGQSSVPSDPQQAAAQDAANQREKSGNKNTGLLTDPSHIGGVGYILNPRYRETSPGEISDMEYKPKYIPNNSASVTDVVNLLSTPPTTAAHGGLMSFAKGGANYLRGRTDGMADKLNTSIDNKQAAKLSHGEFVIPADVVSHLGNGNSDAGADKLYQMMARIRKARTGNPKQGKRINPDKFMPGGLASLNMGGAIGFPTGGAVTGAGAVTSPGTSTSSSLSSWAGPFVTDMLGEASGIAKAPYQAYTGPLTAGASDLQQQAFAGAKTVAGAGYDPTKFTSGTFGAEQAQQYMNPYLSAVLDPQMKELQRQADITRIGDAGRMTRAGAFGGGRQAIMESEGNRNLLNTQADTLGRGYASAYDKAMGQFNTQADRDMGAQKASEESRQFSANFGLKSLADLERMGATQRQIEAEGVAADKTQFEENRDNPAAMVKFKRDLITGLPMSTSTNTKLPMDSLGEMISSVGGLSQFYQMLKDFGINATPAAAATTAATKTP